MSGDSWLSDLIGRGGSLGAGWKTHLGTAILGPSGMELFLLRSALLGSSEDEVLILRQRTRRMLPVGARRCSCILAKGLRGRDSLEQHRESFLIRSEIQSRLQV